MMKIAILGAGNAGCSVAADLSLKGHEVFLIKTSKSMHDQNFEHIFHNGGKISLLESGVRKDTKISLVTRDISKISQVELIIVYVQTNYHESLIRKIVPFLHQDQIVLINPGYLSTAYFLKIDSNPNYILVEAEISFVDCRILLPGLVRVGFRNVRNPLGVFPNKRKAEAKECLKKVGYPFVYTDSVVEAGLHNPNLIVHTIGGIMSIPRIEKTNGNYYMYKEVFTPSVWKLLKALDNEKMDVLTALNLPRLSYPEACKFRNVLDDDKEADEVFRWYASLPVLTKGPKVVDSRFITEDVPQGLVLLESLGKYLKVSTPVTSSLIEIANACLERDFRKSGRSLERLGYENLARILEDGKNNKN